MKLTSRTNIFEFIKLYYQCEYVAITHHLENQWESIPIAYSYYFKITNNESVEVTFDYQPWLVSLNSWLYKHGGR